MDLDQLHRKFSRDKSYVRAYEAIGDTIALAMHCRTVREEQKITQAQLAKAAGVPCHVLSKFECLKGAPPWVLSAVVRALQVPLQERGVDTAKWMKIAPIPPAPPANPAPVTIPSYVRGLGARPCVPLPASDREHVPQVEES